MEIRDLGEFLNYFNKVHQRTMNVVRSIPPDRVDWEFRPGKFTLGDLVRHIAAANRYIFVEVASGKPSAYSGCGQELGASYDEIVQFIERMHQECVEIISGFTPDDLNRKCTTPDGASITTWKWLRAMIEHEIHHRGQIFTYLALLGVSSPPLYGLTSEQVRERSVARA
ncbi:MAG TPA: DinB family protein [Bryobacteraceae bacterium]|nr:DinB family protein [Bryobacteraceae bacterium]